MNPLIIGRTMLKHKFEVELPIPPSHNRLNQWVAGRVRRTTKYSNWMSAAGKKINAALKAPTGLTSNARTWIRGDHVMVTMNVKARSMDPSNAIKPILDALQEHGVYRNDVKVRDVAMYSNRKPLERGESEGVSVEVVSIDTHWG